jgi:hypothetical protein
VLGTWNKLKDLRVIVNAARSQYSADTIFATRRASGFNELFEAVVAKEFPTPENVSQDDVSRLARVAGAGSFSVNPSTTKKGKGKENQQSEVVDGWRLISQERLKNADQNVHPESKWTWGVDLEEQDLRDIVRSADRGLVLPHSGYDESLPDDISSSKYSPLPNLQDFEQEGNAPFLPLSSDITVVPELEPHQFPIEFTIPPLCNEGYTNVPSGYLRYKAMSSAERKTAVTSAHQWVHQPQDYVQVPVPVTYTTPVSIQEQYGSFYFIIILF